ncbi:MAG: SagB/ThcOx family dehydrogenase [Candidatus Sumerlaeota bacterium]|nr:SagB/ThcOx family dehydrogenase [Candidatus Sumerlaeota bacterium]
MNRIHSLAIRSMAISVVIAAALVLAEEAALEKLPQPQTDGGKPLMQALKERKTVRAMSDKVISPQILSNLLWAAFGVNRPETGKRTAPSAMDSQEIDIYVATAAGLSLYDAKEHALKPILKEDMRSKIGGPTAGKTAPLSLIFVADFAKMKKASEDKKPFYSAIDTGYISQNVYLFCASEGLGTVVHDGVDRKTLPTLMNLRPDQKIILGQCVGYPAPEPGAAR